MNLPKGTKVYPFKGICDGCLKERTLNHVYPYLVEFSQGDPFARKQSAAIKRNVVFYCSFCAILAENDVGLTVINMETI